MDAVLRGMRTRVSEEMNEALIQTFTPDEKCWNIVGPEVVTFVLDFLNHGWFDAKVNYTFIALIPKCESPEFMNQLRPISLCNITYKIASKMLAISLKPISIILSFESQSAFIPNRLITNNILVAYELNHYLAHKTWGAVGHATIKLDLSKAYDRVEWTFLERVLDKLGFHSRFVALILSCVSTVSYSYLLDGKKFGYLHSQRGLRQGDPLSQYLFLFCAEAFSHLITRAKNNGDLCGVAISRHGPWVSHLLFADDTLIFCQTTQVAMQKMGRILREFEVASGLMEEGGLGLRKMGAFNQAMLAKQLWRIITKPNAMLSRMLKQKYIPSTDIFSAVAGTGCSFTWRSMLSARELISKEHEGTLNLAKIDTSGRTGRSLGLGLSSMVRLSRCLINLKAGNSFGVLRFPRRNLDGPYFIRTRLICWHLWGARNRLLFENISITTVDLLDRVWSLESVLSPEARVVSALEDAINGLHNSHFRPCRDRLS
ncbi:UNVERIFIED_CONTAM: putative mitochondrial protein [Sesamum radiatum]|uniref:Mitochondrial protein n=1 Tax=Sesamum radiatum TaxID=300843 RepID=A0AAW2U9B5_SESRA